MRSITGTRARLALAALFVTSLVGFAQADTPSSAVFEVAGSRPADRGPAALPDKTGASPVLQRMPTSPQIVRSNQYPNEVEPNDTSATATPIGGTSAAREGNIFPAADVDFWSFSGTAGDRVYAATMTSLSSNASVDSVLELIGTDGTTVIETDADDGSFGATSSSIAGATLPTTGTYFLRVRHASAATQLRPYRLFFQLRSGTPTAETEPNDTFPGQALPAGGWVSGATSATTDADFYSLNLNAGDTVFVSVDLDPERDTVEWNAQTGLGAFGTPPLVLVANDAGAATPDSEAYFMSVKDAGTYGVLVGLPTGGTTFGTYHASITVFPRTDEGVNCTTYTSTNVPVAIPTGPGIVTSTLTVPGNPRIADIDVAVNITHNFMADLDVQLTSPSGNTVGLFSDIGSVTAGSQTTMDVVFDEEGAVPPLFAITQGLRFANELNYRMSWFDGQPAGGTWTLTMRDDATGDGGTLNNWSVRICEAPPPPTCAPGFAPTTVYSTDFESGAAGFTHSGTLDEWELGNPTFAPVTGCNSGTNCWKTDLDNTYEASSNQNLLSPNINLAGLSPPVVVRWAQKYQIESAQFDTFRIDVHEVATPANSVLLFQHLGADMIDNVGNPIVAIQEAAGWGEFSARADSLAGLNVEFNANLASDTTVQRGGLAIDDVSVTACRAISADLAITKTDGVTTAVPGGSVTYTITGSNAGPDAVTGATVADTFPAVETCTWTCVGAGGGTCTAAGSGNINDTTVNLPAGGSVTYTATCAVSAAATGTLSNTATISSTVTDPNPANNSATDTDTLTPQANLGITKTDGVTTAIPGGSVTYTITSSNAGPSNAPGSTVADTFPASLTCTWTCVGAGGGTCTASGSGNISDTVNLPAGGSVTHTATCAVSAGANGTLTNTATVAAPAGVTDPTPGNNSATDTDTLTPQANLGITKTDGVTTVTPGGSTTYTITASNAGQSNATGATVADTFPASLTCTWTCVGAGGGTCTAAGSGNISDTVNLPAGGSVTYTASCAISGSATGTLTNTATVAAPAGVTDPTPANNSATDTDTIQAAADVSITKTDGVTTVTAGGTTTYTITASNAGPSAASSVTVADTFPASLTCTWTCVGAGGGTCTAAGSGNITDAANLPAGGSVTYTASCTISPSATGSIVNTATATVGGGVVDPNPANNSATDTDGVGSAADLSITKTDGVTNVQPGGSTTYTIVASNTGPSSASGVSVTDTFPAGLTCTWTCAAAGGGTCAASGSGNIGDTINLPSGASATYTATCAIATSVTGTLTNTATVSSAVTDPNPANNSATDADTVTPAANLGITKTDGVTQVAPGGTLSYTIVASNPGPSGVTGATVADTFPASCTSVSWTCSGTGTCPAGGSGAINASVDLAIGTQVTFVATCTVDPTSLNGVVISNTATIAAPAGTIELDPVDNTATDTTTVNASGAIVSGTKSVSGSLAQGRDATYTIVLTNSGTAQADNPGDEFVDVLPPQLTLVSATASSGTAVADIGTNTVRWNGAIPSGGSVTITIATTIAITATGSISNQGTIAFDGDANGTNESSALTDDPSVSGAGNATIFGVAQIVPVPALGIPALLLLALGLCLVATQRRRSLRRID